MMLHLPSSAFQPGLSVTETGGGGGGLGTRKMTQKRGYFAINDKRVHNVIVQSRRGQKIGTSGVTGYPPT